MGSRRVNRAHLPRISTRRRAVWSVGGLLQLQMDVLGSMQVQLQPPRVPTWTKGRQLRQMWMNTHQRGRKSRVPTRRRLQRPPSHLLLLLLLLLLDVCCMMLHVLSLALSPRPWQMPSNLAQLGRLRPTSSPRHAI